MRRLGHWLGSLLGVPFSAFTLLTGWQEGHPARKIPIPLIPRCSLSKRVEEEGPRGNPPDAVSAGKNGRLMEVVVVGLVITDWPPNPLTLPSNRHHRSNGECLEGKRENYQVCSVQYCVQQFCTVQCTYICIGFCLTAWPFHGA